MTPERSTRNVKTLSSSPEYDPPISTIFVEPPNPAPEAIFCTLACSPVQVAVVSNVF